MIAAFALALSLSAIPQDGPAATPAPTERQCAVMAAVARAEPFWGAGRAPVARAWDANGELTLACPWARLGLRAPQAVGPEGGAIFWFSTPRSEPGGRARVTYATTEPGPPPHTTFHLCRLGRARGGWRLRAPCTTSAERPAE